MRNLEDPVKRKEATDKSIEARKDGKASKKQAVTRFINNALFDNPTRALYQNKHINDAVAEVILNEMFNIQKAGENSWIQDYIHSFLEEARKNPNSRAADKIASALFTESLMGQIQEYIDKGNERDTEYVKYLIRTTLYDRQKEVYDCILNEPYRKHIIINSRRTGKTELMGRVIVAELYKPNARVAYLNRNSSAAIRQIREPLMTALGKSNLKVIKGSIDAQILYFDNGSRLLILGNNNAADIDKLRGERLSCCIMDECGHQRNIRTLLRETIEPSMIDYGKGSRLIMVGTPPRLPHTYVEDVWNNEDSSWKKWHWTFMDNPFLPDKEHVIENACKDNGVSEDSAFIRREYYGEMGIYDTDAKWIKKYSYNPDEKLPNTFDYAYIGVDWGYEDKAAVVSIVAKKEPYNGSGRAYIVNSWSEAHKGISEVSDEIVRQVSYLKEHYSLAREPIVICDNNEKGAVWDLYQTYHLKNVFTAYKYDLDYALDQLQELMATNKIMIVNDPSGRVREDCDNSLWQRDEETDKIIHKLDDDSWHPNAMMAVLYVSRQFAYDVLGWIDKNKVAVDIARGNYES